MTRAKQAWCKANRYLKSGQREKAIYWFRKTQFILDGERPLRKRSGGMDLGYMFIAFAAVVLIWATAA
jgi:hypothetical protein